MKKQMFILVGLCILLTGCGKEKSNDIYNSSLPFTTTTTTTISTSTTKSIKTTTKNSTKKSTTTSCKKIFNKNYRNVYESERACESAGNNLFMDADTSKVTNFSCEMVKDKCGTSWYYLEWYHFDEKVDYIKAN